MSSQVAAAASSTLLFFEADFKGDGKAGVFGLAGVAGILSSVTSSDAGCMGVKGEGVLRPAFFVTATAVVLFLVALPLLGVAAAREGVMGSFDSKALAFSCTLHLAYGEKSCLDGVVARLAGEKSNARDTPAPWGGVAETKFAVWAFA